MTLAGAELDEWEERAYYQMLARSRARLILRARLARTPNEAASIGGMLHRNEKRTRSAIRRAARVLGPDRAIWLWREVGRVTDAELIGDLPL